MQLRPPHIKIQNWYPPRAVKSIQKKEDGPDCTISTNKLSSKAYQDEANDYLKYRYEIRPLSFAADRIVMKYSLFFFLCVSTPILSFEKKNIPHHPFPFSVSI